MIVVAGGAGVTVVTGVGLVEEEVDGFSFESGLLVSPLGGSTGFGGFF